MTYPEMRRKDRELESREAYKVIVSADYGVLSLSFEDSPYCVALSHVVSGNTIYFHSARQGFKTELIKQNPKGYFLFIQSAETVSEEGSVKYRSCGAMGTLRIVDDQEEKLSALKMLADRHMGSEYAAKAEEMIVNHADLTAVYAFEINKIIGKHNT